MKKIIRNVLINILLISPTFYVFWYYKDNEFFRSFLEFCSSAFLWMTGFGLVGFGLVRIVMSAMRLLEKLREIHYNWKHTRKCGYRDWETHCLYNKIGRAHV